MKEAVKGRAPVSMDALVQQNESPFTAGVLHFPLPAKFRMPQIETFDGTKDPIDHLNTYKNQMELHGYQDPIQCRAFAITLKGPTLAWFKRLPSSFIHLIVHRAFHRIRLTLYRSKNIQESKLSPSDHKAELAGEPEVIRLEIQRRVIKGGYFRRKVRHYRLHRRAWGTIEIPNVLYLKEPSGEHGRSAHQDREVYQR